MLLLLMIMRLRLLLLGGWLELDAWTRGILGWGGEEWLTFAGLEDVRVCLVHWLPELKLRCRDGGIAPRSPRCVGCRVIA